MKEIPKKLYRYRSLSLQELQNLSDAKTWFSHPTKFNDPFDCAYDVELTNASREACLAAIIDVSNGKVTEESFAEWPTELLMQSFQNPLRAVVAEQIKSINSVCCFSEVHNNLLMWGHYCSGHRGFCLEFDTSLTPLFAKAKEVQYSKSFPILDINNILSHNNSAII
jgi:hypothetical protein